MLKAKVYNRVFECIDIAKKYNPSFAKKEFNVSEIKFSVRGCVGGTCLYNWVTRSAVLDFNEGLLKRNENEYFTQVIPHEVAHLIVNAVWGGRAKSHGKEWKQVMKYVFNLEPNRTHSMDTSEVRVRKTKRFKYTCKCGEPHVISTRTHNKIASGNAQYKCTICSDPIKFERQIR